LLDPEELIGYLARHGVTRMVLVPSLLRALLDHAPNLGERLPKLRLWSLSGEALPWELAARFQKAFPGATLLNIYGSSEVAADVTWHEVTERAEEKTGTVPIGRPISNTQVYVLDRYRNPVPVGVRGEIYVGGAGLALGYWRQPELTAERFVENPIAPEKSARLYKTGDLGRWQKNGEIEYLGRIDSEVKVRGMRIDLREIETVLAGEEGIEEAVVELKGEGGEEALEMSREDLATWLISLRAELPVIAYDLEMLLDDRDALGALSFLDDDVARPMAAGLESGRDRQIDALTPGTRLGTYEIVALLGAGGMGEVYRAKDLRLGRDIALKVLPARMSADTNRLARFEREARTVAGLNHPNIVMLHSVEDDGDVRFLTMELVEGQSLDLALAPGGLPIPRVIELGIALPTRWPRRTKRGGAPRLQARERDADERRTREGARLRARLVASDGARSSRAGGDCRLTNLLHGSIMGTAVYGAGADPWRGGGHAHRSSRSDRVYELSSGMRPFTGETHADISHAILRDAPKRLSSVRSDLPRDLERVIDECLRRTRASGCRRHSMCRTRSPAAQGAGAERVGLP
jgi:hypothetical protein